MRRLLITIAAASLLALSLSATVQAANRATVTKATLPSFWVDEEGTFFPATCHETQVINGNMRMERFHCSFDGDKPGRTMCTTDTCTWSSDFDGAPAVRFHFLITPSGRMNGWAKY